MQKIFLITRREYLTRVRKRSFIIMTLLGPLLFGLFYAAIIFIAVNQDLGKSSKTIAVLDASKQYGKNLTDEQKVHFIPWPGTRQEGIDALKEEQFDALVVLPEVANDSLLEKNGIELLALESVGNGLEETIKGKLNQGIKNERFKTLGLNEKVLDQLDPHIRLKSLVVGKEGEKQAFTQIAMGVGFLGAFLIYMFIFLYGVQVMKGVIEEKTNRIVEVMISSVKPFQLMLGKIIGIALVGLTQFMVWVVLSIAIFTLVTGLMGSGSHTPPPPTPMMGNSVMAQQPVADNIGGELLAGLGSIHLGFLLVMFLFYFITGYLFYSSLFAAIGAAVDQETDTQQFMLPITMPLVFGFVAAQSIVLNNPDGAVATWLSMIPLTAPVVMMVRAPFLDGFNLEVLSSMGCMVVGFIFATWLSAKIYRTGILLYGKKPSYKELFKWIFYKTY